MNIIGIFTLQFPPVIELNVGGKHYTTTLLTLVKCKDTMLAAMFSGNYDVKKDQHGRYFIDADGENFHYILNYLRYGELPPQEISPKIYREAVYLIWSSGDGRGVRKAPNIPCKDPQGKF